jgi:hypothetical protein
MSTSLREAIANLEEVEQSMVEQGVTEDYGSWLLAIRYALMLLKGEIET